MKLLLVEDETDLLTEMEEYLSQQDYRCEKASTFATAEEKISLYDYECIVLDISLPDGNGLRLLDLIRKHHPSTGILIVSAKDSLRDKLEGLNLGADDYITKPFHLEELNARVNALIRRKVFKGNARIDVDGLCILTEAQEVYYEDRLINVTRKEYQLLLYFVINQSRVVSRQSIAEHIWGDHFDLADNYDSVYVHVNNLRKKIQIATGKDLIKSVYGVGYKWMRAS